MDGMSRRLRVRHATNYQYQTPVERSEHWLHLRPVHDWRQHVISSRISISPSVELVEYEDVFGNWASRCVVPGPYTELKIEVESIVDVVDVDPFAFSRKPINRPKFPIAWMPWEQAMLAPYLVSEELPYSQMRELYDFAMSFVQKNNGDIMETLFNINLEFFRNFNYIPGSTNLATNPYDVMSSKQGVCQDFSNLFICMARLLGIPARYVCGYVYTGNTGESRAGSDASHAWVQIYIPDIGWKGFDPTNGTLPQTDHVRVAVGRHYRDTAQTSGVVFGGSGEVLSIDVEVEEIAPPVEAAPPMQTQATQQA
jgi:transglutaminase-like putative cysteine protease